MFRQNVPNTISRNKELRLAKTARSPQRNVYHYIINVYKCVRHKIKGLDNTDIGALAVTQVTCILVVEKVMSCSVYKTHTYMLNLILEIHERNEF